VQPIGDDAPPGRLTDPADEDLVVIAGEQRREEGVWGHVAAVGPGVRGRGQVVPDQNARPMSIRRAGRGSRASAAISI
jgi:hypothetical protein